MANSGLGSVVGSLRLGNVDDGTAHTSNEDDTTRSLALHEVTSNTSGEEIGAVNIDTPELSHTVDRILDGVEVLSEAGRCDQVVDLAVLADYIGEDALNRVLIAHWTKSVVVSMLMNQGAHHRSSGQ